MGLELPDICLTGEEKTRKTSPRKPVPTGDRIRARCVTGAHYKACSIAVDLGFLYVKIIFNCLIYYKGCVKLIQNRWSVCSRIAYNSANSEAILLNNLSDSRVFTVRQV